MEHAILAMSALPDHRHDRIVGPGDVDMVVDDVAAISYQLPATMNWQVHRSTERVAHAAVVTGKANTAALRLIASSFSILLMVKIGAIRLSSLMAGSAKASVVVSSLTSNQPPAEGRG
jgi:hypothetical protein